MRKQKDPPVDSLDDQVIIHAPVTLMSAQYGEKYVEEPKSFSVATKVSKVKFQTLQGDWIMVTDRGLHDPSIRSDVIIPSILDGDPAEAMA